MIIPVRTIIDNITNSLNKREIRVGAIFSFYIGENYSTYKIISINKTILEIELIHTTMVWYQYALNTKDKFTINDFEYYFKKYSK
jgi:hypothetical protein